MGSIVSCSKFTQFLVDQQPYYDKRILMDIRPTDGWIGHVKSGTFEAFSGTQHTRDRFNHVFPNTTKAWEPVTAAHCLGTPCDPTEHTIGWGSTRLTYGLEKQSWQTPLLCYDQDMHVTHARENFRYIISDILKPATNAIMSNFLRKRAAQYAGNQYIVGTALNTFVYNWTKVSDEEIYIDTNCNPASVGKLSPQHLQVMVSPLMLVGAKGKTPFEGKRPPMLELVTDMETMWELDKLAGQTTPSISGNWRFEQWDAANKYWAYGFNGQIGNYATRVDPLSLRFIYVGYDIGGNGQYRYQVVLPYTNIASSGAGGSAGLKSVVNQDYQRAQYTFSFIWDPEVIEALVSEATPVNPEMPFSSRNFGGRWQFVMDNLGSDVNGCVIENKRRNKGQFIGDFKLAIAPAYTERAVLWFHKREPACLPLLSTCNAETYPVEQDYDSDNTPCPEEERELPYTSVFTPTVNSTSGDYKIAASSITCDGGPVQHPAISGTTSLAGLVVQLNASCSVVGTWTVNGFDIEVESTCENVDVAFLV